MSQVIHAEDMKVQNVADYHAETCETEQGKAIVNAFFNMLPAQEDVKEWYAGFTPEGYNEWARVVNFTEPQHIINQVVKSEEEGGLGLPHSQKILDIGSGTGVVGQALQKAGFDDLHALDVSKNFLEAVRMRGFYREHHNFFLGRGTNLFPAELKGIYDVITASGVWMPGHMPNVAIDDVHAALKEGGVLATAIRNTMWEYDVYEGYREKFEQMINNGYFEIVKKENFYRGVENGTGLFGRQLSTLLVLRKTNKPIQTRQ